MPIYMDRHDISESITAEQVAELHRQDLKIQHRYGCRGLTYWFDEKRKTTFCLIEAPDSSSIHRMHKEAHGDVPTRIIEVDALLVESFLGRIEDPEPGVKIIDETAFRTIMLIELKKGTLLRNHSKTFQTLVKNFCSESTDILHTYRGATVEKTDYHFLVSFKSVSAAINSAFEIKRLFRKLEASSIPENIVLKTGISTGVPVTEKKQLFEDAVKLARRMCEVVKGEIIISAEVNYLYKEENIDFPFKENKVISLTSEEEKFLTAFMDYTESAWNNSDFKVGNLIKPLGCSKSELYRRILSLTGKSPNTFIKDYRLQQALKLLEKNAGNVSEVAFAAGFSSLSYFTKCFQKKYGCLPSSWLATDFR